jgi:hypothetical protein
MAFPREPNMRSSQVIFSAEVSREAVVRYSAMAVVMWSAYVIFTRPNRLVAGT